MKWLTRQDRLPVGRNEKELVTIALARLARSDVSVADSYLRREWAKSMAKSNLAWVRGQYALAAALNLDSRANDWYHEAGHIRMTEYNAGWKVRAALRQPKIDWKWVIESIDEMPPAQRADTSWVYWKARGLAATGRKDQAQAAYASIADRFDFYGQLAAEELGRRITVPPRPAPITDAEIAEARANPGLRRAVQLFRLGWRAEAVPEWNFALRGERPPADGGRRAGARREHLRPCGQHLGPHREEFDFSQRFIAPFEGRVTAKANAIALDPAWVYGLIRQESRFIMDARSHVGASGLMQLMPATAKWVAGKIGMTDFTPASVNDFDTNTELGTNYLNMVLRDLDGSQMLASAGYNAGPRRPHNWRSTFTHPVEGAIFAETIPFNETRTYVKNVMSNSVYYAAMFSGQPQSLKERLGRSCPGRRKHHAAMTQDPATQGLRVYIVGGAVRDAAGPAGRRSGLGRGRRHARDMARRGFMPVGGDFPVFLHPRTKGIRARPHRAQVRPRLQGLHLPYRRRRDAGRRSAPPRSHRQRYCAQARWRAGRPAGRPGRPARARVPPRARPSRKTPCASCGWAASRRASPISASRPRRWRCAAAWSRPARPTRWWPSACGRNCRAAS